MEYSDTVTIACINFHAQWGDKPGNLLKMKNLTAEAARQGNQIIVFPELSLSGYECSEDIHSAPGPCKMHRENAEVIPGPATEEIRCLAEELGVYVVFGLPEKDGDNAEKHYISSVIIGPEGLVGVYRKLHLAPYPRFTEPLCFSPGNDIPVWETSYGLVGILICYDFYFFPELARIMALKGARLLINTSASVTGPGKPYFIVQQTGCRATENLVYAASSNLVGRERTKTYYGHSVIAGPQTPRPAFVYAEGGEAEEIVSATLNFKKLQAYIDVLNWKKDIRGDVIDREMAKCRHK